MSNEQIGYELGLNGKEVLIWTAPLKRFNGQSRRSKRTTAFSDIPSRMTIKCFPLQERQFGQNEKDFGQFSVILSYLEIWRHFSNN